MGTGKVVTKVYIEVDIRESGDVWVKAIHDNKAIATLTICGRDTSHVYSVGEVMSINVREKYRRQGIATQLWNEAVRLAHRGEIVMPKHSPLKTDDGKAWVSSLT